MKLPEETPQMPPQEIGWMLVDLMTPKLSTFIKTYKINQSINQSIKHLIGQPTLFSKPLFQGSLLAMVKYLPTRRKDLVIQSFVGSSVDDVIIEFSLRTLFCARLVEVVRIL